MGAPWTTQERLLLLHTLQGNGHDFAHPKAGRVVTALASHLGVTPESVRKQVRHALADPAVKETLQDAVPIYGGDAGGGRTHTTDGADRRGDNYVRSRHDYTRGNWEWSGRGLRACNWPGVAPLDWMGDRRPRNVPAAIARTVAWLKVGSPVSAAPLTPWDGVHPLAAIVHTPATAGLPLAQQPPLTGRAVSAPLYPFSGAPYRRPALVEAPDREQHLAAAVAAHCAAGDYWRLAHTPDGERRVPDNDPANHWPADPLLWAGAGTPWRGPDRPRVQARGELEITNPSLDGSASGRRTGGLLPHMLGSDRRVFPGTRTHYVGNVGRGLHKPGYTYILNCKTWNGRDVWSVGGGKRGARGAWWWV